MHRQSYNLFTFHRDSSYVNVIRDECGDKTPRQVRPGIYTLTRGSRPGEQYTLSLIGSSSDGQFETTHALKIYENGCILTIDEIRYLKLNDPKCVHR